MSGSIILPDIFVLTSPNKFHENPSLFVDFARCLCRRQTTCIFQQRNILANINSLYDNQRLSTKQQMRKTHAFF